MKLRAPDLKPKTWLLIIAGAIGFFFVMFIVIIGFQIVKLNNIRMEQQRLLTLEKNIDGVLDSINSMGDINVDNPNVSKIAEKYVRQVLGWTKKGEIIYRPQY
jgi:hypothetical protein